MHADLDLPLIKSGLPAHPHKVVLVKSSPQLLRPLPYPPLNLAAPIYKPKSQITIPPLGYPMVLGRHQKERIDRLIITDIGNEKRLDGSSQNLPPILQRARQVMKRSNQKLLKKYNCDENKNGGEINASCKKR